MTRVGIGVNQGRVLGILLLMSPRPVPGNWLAEAAFPTGDLTQGRRVLTSLEVRGLIERDMPGQWKIYDPRNRWLITELGLSAFHRWFSYRFRVSEFGEL